MLFCQLRHTLCKQDIYSPSVKKWILYGEWWSDKWLSCSYSRGKWVQIDLHPAKSSHRHRPTLLTQFSLPSCLCLSTPFHTNTHSPSLYTHTHFSQYGSALGSSGASSGGQCSQVWTGERAGVLLSSETHKYSALAIWDGLHIYVILLKTLCQQTPLRPYNQPPFLPTKGVHGMAHRCAAQLVLICNKLVITFTTRCRAAPWLLLFYFKSCKKVPQLTLHA